MLQIGHFFFFTLYLISPINKGIQDMSMVKGSYFNILERKYLMINWENFTTSWFKKILLKNISNFKFLGNDKSDYNFWMTKFKVSKLL